MARKQVGTAPSAPEDAVTKGYADGLGGGGTAVLDYITPGDQNMFGWSVPPELCSSQVAITQATSQLTRVKITRSGTVGNVYFGVTNVASSLTSCKILIFNTSGVLVSSTAEMLSGTTTNVLTTGEKVVPLLTPLDVTAGQEYWVVIYAIGTTSPVGPTIRATLTVSGINYGLTTSSPLRTARKTGLTAAPTSIVKTEYTAFANQIPLFMLGG
jgi:hypothetical protein